MASVLVAGLSLAGAGIARPESSRESPPFPRARTGTGPDARVAPLRVGLGSLAAIVSFVGAPFRDGPSPRRDATRGVAREEGWRAIRFAVEDWGCGVYLSVRGTAQFDVAYVSYDDGTQDRVELGSASRNDGIYALVEFEGTRRVREVSMLARAVSPAARLGVLLGR